MIWQSRSNSAFTKIKLFFSPLFASLCTVPLLTVSYLHTSPCNCFSSLCREKFLKVCKLKYFWLAVYGSTAIFALHFHLHISTFTWKCFFCCSISLMVSSPKNFIFFPLWTLDKSISSLTDLIRPIFTRRSYRLILDLLALA